VLRLNRVKTREQAQRYIAIHASADYTHDLGSDPNRVLSLLVERLTYIVETGTEVTVGTASITQTEPGIATLGVCLSPEFRGRGYGTMLVEALEEEARDQGCFAARVDVFCENEAALRLFRKAGFREYVLMEKSLSRP
jgi:predicted GNAT family acetyltransferase